MILYHGSDLEIKVPDIVHFRKNLDFGCGFYTTPLYEQAEKWCEKFLRRGKNGIIFIYELDESVLKDCICILKGANGYESRTVNFADEICKYRREFCKTSTSFFG